MVRMRKIGVLRRLVLGRGRSTGTGLTRLKKNSASSFACFRSCFMRFFWGGERGPSKSLISTIGQNEHLPTCRFYCPDGVLLGPKAHSSEFAHFRGRVPDLAKSGRPDPIHGSALDLEFRGQNGRPPIPALFRAENAIVELRMLENGVWRGFQKIDNFARFLSTKCPRKFRKFSDPSYT